MFKKIFSGAAATVTLAGCNALPPTPAPEVKPTDIPSESPTDVRIPNIPDKLPAPVRAAARAAMSIGVGVTLNAGSGVRIGKNYVLTAGHVADGKLRSCESLNAMAADGTQGIYKNLKIEFTTEADLALFTINSLANGLSPAPHLAISKTPPRPEDVVYFVNYEPAKDGARTPGSDVKAYRDPAIYAGVVMPDDNPNDRQVKVLTGFQSYGTLAAVNSRTGSSGGPLFNGEGELIGIVSTGKPGPLTAEDIYEYTNVKPADLPPGTEANLGFTGVQLVDKETVAALMADVTQEPACHIPGIN